jgi:hypothetical protein
MPPTIVRGFAADNNFDGSRQIKGLGSHIGPVQLEDGSVVDGSRVLMRDQCANTDHCVGGSLQDAFTKGWGCLLLSDGCATTSPIFARQCIEFNCKGG